MYVAQSDFHFVDAVLYVYYLFCTFTKIQQQEAKAQTNKSFTKIVTWYVLHNSFYFCAHYVS